MEFHALGALSVRSDGVAIGLGGPKQRMVLGLLLLRANQAVSNDDLVAGLWGDDAPAAARHTIQSYVSELRKVLGGQPERSGPGYLLRVAPEQFDVLRFEALAAEGRRLLDDDPAAAADVLAKALGLWEGRAYSDFASEPALDLEVRRLDELRLRVLEDRIEADLRSGGHAEVIGELEALTREHPFRERFTGQLMLALYLSGRQVEALRVFTRTRETLAEELGIDPSVELQRLEERILAQDPELEARPRPSTQTAALLVTDLTASTPLWEFDPEAMAEAIDLHDQMLKEVVKRSGGTVVKSTGDGLLAVFADVTAALTAAIEGQGRFSTADFGRLGPLQIRMAIDWGELTTRPGDVLGPVVNRASRLVAAGHGGQVLLSDEVENLLTPGTADLVDLGEHRFKGLGQPRRVWQVEAPGLQSAFPPLRVDGAVRPSHPAGFARGIRGYELRELVGEGDFGMVYRAYQASVGREVAIKVIRPEYANQPAFVGRFQAEAQFVAQLEHPHIVSLYDYWRDPDGAYLVMRYLRGGSLRQALRRGSFRVPAALHLLDQVGSALSFSHRQGVIHRDLKPGNVLMDEDGNAYLSDFGISTRLIDAAGAPMTASLAYLPPEEQRGEPLTPQSDIFSLGVLTFEMLTGVSPTASGGLPSVREARADLPVELDEVIRRATSDQAASRFERVDDFVRAVRRAVGADGVGAPAEARSISEPGPVRNPYKGLRAFEETDALDFFGRDALVDELLEAIGSNRLVAVVGPSGSGKSSVVRAALVPALRAGRLPGSRSWLITEMFPGSYPFEELEAALQRIAVERVSSLIDDLRSDERGLLRSIKQLLPRDDSELVLIIDQFEELFSLTGNEDARRLFLDSLATLAADERGRARIIITLRADFYDRPLQYPAFGELVGAAVVSVTPPAEDALAQAISRPARGAGLDLEPGLVGEVIHDVEGQPGALPLMQYALTELFNQRTGSVLTVAGYRATGGVLGALGRRAEELYRGLSRSGQEAARQLFLRLVTVDENADDTRRRVRRSELRGLDVDQAALDEIIHLYGNFRLLSFDREPLTRTPTVEVAHEALLQEWARLREWIDEQREELLLGRRLAESAGHWIDAEKEPSYLFTGGRLEQFEAWAADTNLFLTEDEQSFLRASRESEDRQLATKRRRRVGVIAGFAAAAVVAIALAVLAFLNEQDAQSSAAEAERQRTAAVLSAEREASAAAEAETNAELARSRELAAAAINVLDDDPELSVLLAVQAADIGGAVPVESASALHEALVNHRLSYTHSWPEDRSGDANVGPVSADGRYLATAMGGNYLEVWDIENDKLLWALQNPSEALVLANGLYFSIDGSRLVGGVSQRPEAPPGEEPDDVRLGVHAWDVATGRETLFVDMGGPCGAWVTGLAAEADLALVQTVKPVDTVSCDQVSEYGLSLVDLNTGEVTALGGLTPGSGAAISADGRFLATGGDFTSTRVIELSTGRTVFDRPAEDFNQLFRGPRALSSDGGLLLTGARPLQVWDVADGTLVTQFDQQANLGFGGAWFNADASLVYAIGRDGVLRAWNATTGEEMMALHTGGNILDASVTADGTKAGVSWADRFGLFDLTPSFPAELGGVDLCPGLLRTHSLSVAAGRGAVLVVCNDSEFPTAFVFDLATTEVIAEVPNLSGQVVRLSPDGGKLAAFDVGAPSGVHIRDIASGEVAVTLEGLCTAAGGSDPEWPGCADPFTTPFGLDPFSMSFSPDGSKLAISGSGVWGVWNAATGDLIRVEPGDAFGLTFSAAGDQLALGVGDSLRIYDTATWETDTETPTPPAIWWPYAFTPDGGRLVGVGPDIGNIGVIDLETMETTNLVPLPHDGETKRLALSEDRSLVASAGGDGFVRVWHTTTGALVHEIPLGETQVQNVEFIDDDRHLVVTPQEGPVLILTIDLDELLEVARGRLTRGFTAAECDKYNLDPCPDLAALRAS